MRTFIKILAAVLPSLLFLVGGHTVFAAPIASQTVSSATRTSGVYGNWTQYLGNGLSGSVASISFYAAAGAQPSSIFPRIFSCDDALLTVNCAYQLNSTVYVGYAGASKTIVNIDLSSAGVVLNPSKYYLLIFSATSTDTFYMYGSSNNDYSAGCFGAGVTGTTCDTSKNGSLVDSYFDIQPIYTVASSSSITLNSPLNGAISASTTVNFNFTYTADSSLNVSTWTLNIIDVGQGLTFSASPTSTPNQNLTLTGAASTGTYSVSRTAVLNLGHAYTYTVSICGPLVFNSPCVVSPTYSFTVGSTAFGYNVTLSNAGSSTNASDFAGFGSVIAVIASKPPLSWFDQFVALFGPSASSSASSSIPVVDINLAGLGIGSTTAMGNFLPDLRFDKNSILYFMPIGIYNLLYSLQGVAFYFLLGWYLFNRARGIFRLI